MWSKRKLLSAAPFLFTLSLAVGCAGKARVGQFQNMALAGSTYAEAMDSVLRTAGDTTVDANSRRLIESRKLAEVSEDELARQNEVLTAYLAEIELLRQHTRVLAAYFEALAKLASGEPRQEIGTEVAATVPKLNELSRQLRGSGLLDGEALAQRISSTVGSLIVREHQARALHQELELRKETIAETLVLHEALLDAISGQLMAEFDFFREREIERRVTEPFLSGSFSTEASEERWIGHRHQMLVEPAVIDNLERAKGAIAVLLEAWRRLLDNRLDSFDLRALVFELRRLAAEV